MGSRVASSPPRVALGGVVAAALLVPVVFARQLADPFMAPKATVLWWCAIVAGLGIAVAASAGGGRPLPRLRARWAVAALVGWTTLATVVSATPWTSWWGSHGRHDGLLTLLAVVVLGAALITGTWREPSRLEVVALALGASGLLGLVALVVERLGWAFDWQLQGLTDVVVGLGGNPNFSGAQLALVVPLVLAARRRVDRRGVGAALIALALALAVGVWTTGTRAGLLALVGGVAVAGALVPEILPRIVRIGAALVTVLLLVVIVAGGVAPGAVRGSPLGSATLAAPDGLLQRANIWDASASVVVEYPLVGVGPDGLGRVEPRHRSSRGGLQLIWADEAHNVVLDRAATAGLPAALAFGWLVVVTGLGAWRARRTVADEHRWLLAGFGGLTGGYLLQGAFSIDAIGLLLMGALGLAALLVLTDPGAIAARAELAAATGRRGGEEPAGSPAGWVVGLGSVVALLLAIAVARPAVADRQHQRALRSLGAGDGLGALAADTAAASWLSHEPVYRQGQAEALVAAAADGSVDPALRRTLLDEAIVAYDRALDLAPGDPRLLAAQAQVHVLASAAALDRDAALDHLDRGEDLLQGLLGDLEATDDLQRPYGQLLESRARLLEGAERDEALEAAADRFELARAYRPDRVDALVGLARIRLEQGREEEALELLEAASDVGGGAAVDEAITELRAQIERDGG